MQRAFLEKASWIAGIVSCIIAFITFFETRSPTQSPLHQHQDKEEQTRHTKAILEGGFSEKRQEKPYTPANPSNIETFPPSTSNKIEQNIPPNMSQKVQEYWRNAAKGDLEAMTNLAYAFAVGDGTPVNDQEALRWYKNAAELGNRDAICSLGISYAWGDYGQIRDLEKAKKLYEKAIQLGGTRCLTHLAYMYLTGRGAPVDYAVAQELLSKAVEDGDARAMYHLGWMYDNGRGVVRSKNEALRLWRAAAEKGDEFAQKELRKIRH